MDCLTRLAYIDTRSDNTSPRVIRGAVYRCWAPNDSKWNFSQELAKSKQRRL